MNKKDVGAQPSALSPQSLTVGRLPYLNVYPFFLTDDFPTAVSASPRRLGEEAAQDRIDAGPLSLADAWRLEDRFEPLGEFGIAVRGPARSVLLVSRVLLEDLDQARVGVTDQTSTSSLLLEAILVLREGVKPVLMEGFSSQDSARLLIGDQALLESEGLRANFPHVYDLGREWYLWRERPFVFARWMVRRTVSPHLKEELVDRLDASLRRYEKNRDTAVWRAADRYPLSPRQIRDYLAGFAYRLGPGELEAADLFRSMVAGLRKGPAC